MTGEKPNAIRIQHKSKIVHFLRHAEGLHNVEGEVNRECYKKEEHEDAELSELGYQQCEKFNEMVQTEGMCTSAQLLVVSPMRRTLQSATHCFSHLIHAFPWVACESIREQTGGHPCDRRRPISEHAVNFPHVDFSQIASDIDPLYFQYDGREPSEDLVGRGRAFLDWLAQRQEREIIVVTHSAFLLTLLQKVLALDGSDAARFRNCELRTFSVSHSGN